jgi:hypothetical protein
MLPNSIDSLGSWAFSKCKNLKSVTLPDKDFYIGEDVFKECASIQKPLYNSLVFVYLPRTYSGSYTIPYGIKRIERRAFGDGFMGEHCEALTSIEIPNTVVSIGDEAFYGCNSLTNVTIPYGVKYIGKGAFGSSKLTSIDIPSSVEYIGDGAFRSCMATSVTLPNSVKYVGVWAFENYKLIAPIYNDHILAAVPTSFTGSYSVPDGIKMIAGSAFEGCQKLTAVNIPNSV